MPSASRISDYALIGDCHSAALVSRAGAIDWCCFHRFDRRSVFARLLDDRAGHFSIAPAGDFEVLRAYRPDSNVLETRFETAAGVVALVDCFAMSEQPEVEPPAAARRKRPPMQLLRWLRCERGEVDLEVELSPRFEYGRTVPKAQQRDVGLFTFVGGAGALLLETDLPLQVCACGDLSGRTVLREGEERFCSLTSMAPHRLHTKRHGAAELRRRLEAADAFWRAWAGRGRYSGEWPEAVKRSALVLKALTNGPTGALVAAPTTSLPEELGGRSNWDYRYTWLRDASMHIDALFQLGHESEAHAFYQWLIRTTAGRAEDLQVVYGVGGERFLPELELEWLSGYGGSRPVRVGNAAMWQLQLDVYGHLLATAWSYHQHGGAIEEDVWAFLCDAVDVVGRRWREPDNGIWEDRDERQPYVTSRMLCWMAVDRAIRLAEALDLHADVKRWRRLAEDIRESVLQEGVDPHGGTLRRLNDTDEVDASSLLAPLVGLLPAGDARMSATIARIERELTEGAHIFRSKRLHGSRQNEGAFFIAGFWMVMVRAQRGELERATRDFQALIACANDVGLLSEEIIPRTGELLGNFPQAYSHIGLISAALALDAARGGERPSSARHRRSGER